MRKNEKMESCNTFSKECPSTGRPGLPRFRKRNNINKYIYDFWRLMSYDYFTRQNHSLMPSQISRRQVAKGFQVLGPIVRGCKRQGCHVVTEKSDPLNTLKMHPPREFCPRSAIHSEGGIFSKIRVNSPGNSFSTRFLHDSGLISMLSFIFLPET